MCVGVEDVVVLTGGRLAGPDGCREVKLRRLKNGTAVADAGSRGLEEMRQWVHCQKRWVQRRGGWRETRQECRKEEEEEQEEEQEAWWWRAV